MKNSKNSTKYLWLTKPFIKFSRLTPYPASTDINVVHGIPKWSKIERRVHSKRHKDSINLDVRNIFSTKKITFVKYIYAFSISISPQVGITDMASINKKNFFDIVIQMYENISYTIKCSVWETLFFSLNQYIM